MLALGIDPGSKNIGISWIREEGEKVERGTVLFSAPHKIPARYAIIRQKLETQLLALPEAPKAVSIELPEEKIFPSIRAKGEEVSIYRLHAAFAICVAETARIYPDIMLFPVKYEAWTGGLQKGIFKDQLYKKYKIEKAISEDELDALGIADFGFEVLRKNAHHVEEKHEVEPNEKSV